MLTTTDFDCRKNDLRLIVRLTVTARRNQELGHKATRHSTVIYFDNAVLTSKCLFTLGFDTAHAVWVWAVYGKGGGKRYGKAVRYQNLSGIPGGKAVFCFS